MESERSSLKFLVLQHFDEFPRWCLQFVWVLIEDDLKGLLEGNEDPESLSTVEQKLVQKQSQKAMGILVR